MLAQLQARRFPGWFKEYPGQEGQERAPVFLHSRGEAARGKLVGVSGRPIQLVIDGHDGAGKTTLAARLAEALGGRHVRPFSGTLGALQLWCGERGDTEFTTDLAKRAIEYALDQNRDARVIVFDRHWMTVCTLLPEGMWSRWQPHPPTALCTASLEVTLARLGARDEPQESIESHQHYMGLYRTMIERFGGEVIDTSGSVEESFGKLLAWAQPLVR